MARVNLVFEDVDGGGFTVEIENSASFGDFNELTPAQRAAIDTLTLLEFGSSETYVDGELVRVGDGEKH